jgi:integrase
MGWLEKKGKVYYMVWKELSKSGKWQTRRKSTKTHNKTIANKMLRDHEEIVCSGLLTSEHSRMNTLGKFYEKYLELDRLKNSENTVKIKEWIIKKHFLGYFGEGYRLDRFTRAAIEDYQAYRKKLGKSNKTINHETFIITSMLRCAAGRGIILESQIPRMKSLRIERKRVRFLSSEEIERVLSAAADRGDDVNCMLHVLIFAGLRFGEYVNLLWENVDLKRREIYITASDNWSPKSRRVRMIPMITRLQEYLDERCDRRCSEYIRGESTEWTLERVIRLVIKDAGLEIKGSNKVTAHTFRHTYASHLVMHGVPLYTVGQLMGHKDQATTQIYAHLAPDHLHSAIAQYEKAIEL